MTDWIPEMIEQGGYWAILFLMALENIFPPIPSEVIMGLGGVGVGEGRFGFLPLVVAGTAGTLIGNYFWFWFGRRFTEDQMRVIARRHGRWLTIDVRTVNQIDGIFDRHGQWIVFIARFLPTIRTMSSIPAGLFGMIHTRLIIATLAGAAIWNSALVYAGLRLQENVADLDRYLGPASTAILLFFIGIYIWRVIFWSPREN